MPNPECYHRIDYKNSASPFLCNIHVAFWHGDIGLRAEFFLSFFFIWCLYMQSPGGVVERIYQSENQHLLACKQLIEILHWDCVWIGSMRAIANIFRFDNHCVLLLFCHSKCVILPAIIKVISEDFQFLFIMESRKMHEYTTYWCTAQKRLR